MKHLHIGADGWGFPIELATGSIAMLATKGAGKTYSSAVLAEELVERSVPVTIIDPVGVHWGLKSSASGKRAGYPFTIFGGDHADLPLEEGAGEILARWTVERQFCSIIDVSHFRKAAIYRFLTPFLNELYRLNRKPMHLVCDEADLYAPQHVQGDTAKLVGAMEDIVRRGRARGIGSTLITQRPASLNKDVLTQCDSLFALRMGHPKDLEPVMAWVRVHGDLEKADAMMKGLPSLPTGTAWIWAPRAGIFALVKIRKRTTFDSSRTPEIGQEAIEPATFAKVDLEALGEEMKATIERAKENDPTAIKAELAKAKKHILALEDKIHRHRLTEPEIRQVLVLDSGAEELMRFTGEQLRLAHADFQRIEKSIAEKAEWVRRKIERGPKVVITHEDPRGLSHGFEVERGVKVDSPMAKALRVVAAQREIDSDKTLDRCQRAILIALSQFGSARREDVAIRAIYSVSSGGFANALAKLRTRALIEGVGQSPLSITKAGQEALGNCEELPAGEARIEAWMRKLSKCERAILEVLISRHPEGMSRQEVAEKSGYAESSGGFANSLSILRGLELISRGSPMSVNATLVS